MRNLRTLAALLALVLVPATVGAATITFEGSSGNVTGVGSFVDVDGYRFTITGGTNSGFEVITNQANIVEANTTKLFAANHTEVTMTRIDGAAFSLLGVDIGGSFIGAANRWADHVDAISSAGLATAVLNGQGPTYVHLSPGFIGVTSVSFIPTVNADLGANNYEFTLDNIQVDAAVPEPSTVVLIGLGLAGLAIARRRAQ